MSLDLVIFLTLLVVMGSKTSMWSCQSVLLAFGGNVGQLSTIDYPTCPRDDHERTIAEFREQRASRVPCIIVVLSVLDPLDPCLLANILRDYALEFEVRVESTLKDLRECLTQAIRDKDCCRELLDATVEDYDEMGRIMTRWGGLMRLSLPPLEQSLSKGVQPHQPQRQSVFN